MHTGEKSGKHGHKEKEKEEKQDTFNSSAVSLPAERKDWLRLEKTCIRKPCRLER